MSRSDSEEASASTSAPHVRDRDETQQERLRLEDEISRISVELCKLQRQHESNVDIIDDELCDLNVDNVELSKLAIYSSPHVKSVDDVNRTVLPVSKSLSPYVTAAPIGHQTNHAKVTLCLLAVIDSNFRLVIRGAAWASFFA